MAVIKIFDSKGTKTLVLMGNALEQEYDSAPEYISEASEVEDSNPFA